MVDRRKNVKFKNLVRWQVFWLKGIGFKHFKPFLSPFCQNPFCAQPFCESWESGQNEGGKYKIFNYEANFPFRML